MADKKMIIIELTEQEAEQFKLFRQYQDNILVLLKSGVFTIKSANVTLQIDQNGRINDIERKDTLFSRRVKLSTV